MDKTDQKKDKKDSDIVWEKRRSLRLAVFLAFTVFGAVLVLFLWSLGERSFFDYFNFNKKKDFNIDRFSAEFNDAVTEFEDSARNMKNHPLPDGYESGSR